MTLVAYTKIKADAKLDNFFERVQNAFPHAENCGYLDEIRQRKSPLSTKESLSALLVLSELLRKAGIDSSALILSRRESGKPYFKNSRIEFSLSHSHGYAAAAISNESRVGIDLEAAEISPEKAAKLAERFFSEGEKSELEAHPDSFLKLWTKKEAYAKMQGTPLSNLIASEKKGIATERENAFFVEFKADKHPLTVCLENPCEITGFEEIIF